MPAKNKEIKWGETFSENPPPTFSFLVNSYLSTYTILVYIVYRKLVLQSLVEHNTQYFSGMHSFLPCNALILAAHYPSPMRYNYSLVNTSVQKACLVSHIINTYFTVVAFRCSAHDTHEDPEFSETSKHPLHSEIPCVASTFRISTHAHSAV
jgi:hypothetical protein